MGAQSTNTYRDVTQIYYTLSNESEQRAQNTRTREKQSNIEINVTIRISIETKHNNIICCLKIPPKNTHNRINERFSLFSTSKDILLFVDILRSWYSRRSLAAVLFNKTKQKKCELNVFFLLLLLI